MPPNHMRIGFENAVAVYSFLPVETGCPQPQVSYFAVGVLLNRRYIMIGSGKTTNTRIAIHIVDMVAGVEEEIVAIEYPKFILEMILTPASGADIESITFMK